MEMELSLTTPALLFPAVSLLLLAYTNRFLAITNLIRNLRKDMQNNVIHPNHSGQLDNLIHRIIIIRNMQVMGIGSLLGCVVTMFLIYTNFQTTAQIMFGISLILMMGSLAFSLRESLMSANAIKLELSDMKSETVE